MSWVVITDATGQEVWVNTARIAWLRSTRYGGERKSGADGKFHGWHLVATATGHAHLRLEFDDEESRDAAIRAITGT